MAMSCGSVSTPNVCTIRFEFIFFSCAAKFEMDELRDRLGHIPMARLLGVRKDGMEFDGNAMRWRISLEDFGKNDKGSAFAGALSAVSLLCGWSLVTALLESRGIRADVVSKHADTNFTAPVRTDYVVSATASDDVDSALRAKHHPKVSVRIVIHSPHDTLCVESTVLYVVLRETDRPVTAEE